MSFYFPRLFIALALILAFAITPFGYAWAQSGNPFARPAPTPPPAAAQPSVVAPPVPPLPPKLFEPDESELKKSFESLSLVAIAGTQAVLRASDAVYYVRNGDYFSYQGMKVKVKIDGNRLQLFSEKNNDEAFVAEVGNGVVTSSKPSVKNKKDADKESKVSSVAPAPATPPAPAAAASSPPAKAGVKK